ncbi:unnamed protein product, partial [Polarella glacialis]
DLPFQISYDPFFNFTLSCWGFEIIRIDLMEAKLGRAQLGAVATGSEHSLVVLENGECWAWGLNDKSQLWVGFTTNQSTPVKVPFEAKVMTVAVGSHHSFVVLENGECWAWGWNDKGQLGVGSTTDQSTPVKVPFEAKVMIGSAGYHHSLVVLENGECWAWGWNDRGQLGVGSTTDHGTPVKVPFEAKVMTVAAGYHHSLVVLENGECWAWGWNDRGQLWVGSTTDHGTPVKVPFEAKVMIVAAGFRYSIVVLENGECWAWGWNDKGQPGVGSTTDHGTPVKVPFEAKVMTVAAGSRHSLVVLENGECWAWGWNDKGQLGVGSTTDHGTPVKVPFEAKVMTEFSKFLVSDFDCLCDDPQDHSVAETMAAPSDTQRITADVAGESDEVGSVPKSSNLDSSSGERSTLKLKWQGEYYRMAIIIKDRIQLEHIQAAISQLTGKHLSCNRAKYMDEEGDLCVLCASTFEDFRYVFEARLEQPRVVHLEVDVAQLPHGPAAADQADTFVTETVGEVGDDEFQFDHSEDDQSDGIADDFEVVGSSARCFLRRALLKTPDQGYTMVDKLRVGDRVLGSSGRHLEVAYAHLHPKAQQQLIALRTAQAELTITFDHRVVVPRSGTAETIGEKLAKDLVLGDVVLCGTRRQKLTKIQHYFDKRELVEIRFNPDEPVVETFMAPCHGILTKGEAMPVIEHAVGALGPFFIEGPRCSKQHARARSAGP